MAIGDYDSSIYTYDKIACNLSLGIAFHSVYKLLSHFRCVVSIVCVKTPSFDVYVTINIFQEA